MIRGSVSGEVSSEIAKGPVTKRISEAEWEGKAEEGERPILIESVGALGEKWYDTSLQGC